MLTGRQRAKIKEAIQALPEPLVEIEKPMRHHNRTYNIIIIGVGGAKHIIKNIKGKRYETDCEARERAMEGVREVHHFIGGLET